MKKTLLNKLLAALIASSTLLAVPVFANALGDGLANAASSGAGGGGGGGGGGGDDPYTSADLGAQRKEYQQGQSSAKQLVDKLGSIRAADDAEECERWLRRDLRGLQANQDKEKLIRFYNLDRYGLELLADPEFSELSLDGPSRVMPNKTRNLDWSYGCMVTTDAKGSGSRAKGMWTPGDASSSIETYRRWGHKWWGLHYPVLVKTVEILNGYYKRADQGLPPIVLPGSPRPKNDAEAERLIKVAQQELRDAMQRYPFADPIRFPSQAAQAAKAKAKATSSAAAMNELNNQ